MISKSKPGSDIAISKLHQKLIGMPEHKNLTLQQLKDFVKGQDGKAVTLSRQGISKKMSPDLLDRSEFQHGANTYDSIRVPGTRKRFDVPRAVPQGFDD